MEDVSTLSDGCPMSQCFPEMPIYVHRQRRLDRYYYHWESKHASGWLCPYEYNTLVFERMLRFPMKLCLAEAVTSQSQLQDSSCTLAHWKEKSSSVFCESMSWAPGTKQMPNDDGDVLQVGESMIWPCSHQPQRYTKRPAERFSG